MNAIEHTAWRRAWQRPGKSLPRPRAVVSVSAHWETRGVAVTASAKPETIHDFFGFPRELFAVEYPVPGEPELARAVAQRAGDAAIPIRLDDRRGLDHGALSVLCAMYPDAHVPVVQLRLDTHRPGEWHCELAQPLAFLRDKGVR